MSKKISGAEFPLQKIFSAEFEYLIPQYQRPYAWTLDQASELFDDLYDFYISESDEGYFLGSIVLIKEEGNPRADVIDGQQRLTTLTILFAVLAAKVPDDKRNLLTKYITEEGDEITKLEAKQRLTLRARDKDFFEKYVQSLKIKKLLDLDTKSLQNESQRNIQRNCKYFLEKIEEKFQDRYDDLQKFTGFLVTNCFLVTVSTPSHDSAFRVFSVMNSRGLDLQMTDIIKADVIGNIEGECDQNFYSDRWEEIEVNLERSGFNDLFSYVRMIYAKSKAQKTLLEEFKSNSNLVNKMSSPKMFIDEILEPYASVLLMIRHSKYIASENAQDVNIHISWLNRVEDSDWIPPAMLFLKEHKDNTAYVLWFFQKLEILATFMYICGKNINKRIERYAKLISQLEKNHNLDNPVREIELTDEEKNEMKTVLDGDIYLLSARKRNFILLRLDSFISDGGAFYDSKVFTTEHVLPQTIEPNSEWEKNWPNEEDRLKWLHRIANLIPLNRKRNSSAQNYDFKYKKEKYFTGYNEASSYALTTQVLREENWIVETLERRQEKLMSVMTEKWELE